MNHGSKVKIEMDDGLLWELAKLPREILLASSVSFAPLSNYMRPFTAPDAP